MFISIVGMVFIASRVTIQRQLLIPRSLRQSDFKWESEPYFWQLSTCINVMLNCSLCTTSDQPV